MELNPDHAPDNDTEHNQRYDGLIEDLKNAPEGSRKLSDRFLKVHGWTIGAEAGAHTMYIPPDNSAPLHRAYVLDPTQSIDDARAFVPKGMGYCLGHLRTAKRPHAWVGETLTAYAKTEALALCIAILEEKRARDGMEADK